MAKSKLTKPDIATIESNYQKLKVAVAYLLEKEDKTSETNTLSTPDLFKVAKAEFPELTKSVPEGTFGVYVSRAANDPDSRINTLGKRKGYYLTDKDIKSRLGEADEDESEKGKAERKNRESLLYPAIKAWVMEQGYRAADISASKIGGIWGNPDLCGLRLTKTIASYEVEILTVEVKASHANYERQFFEAVSHRRFAHRTYFAFAHPADQVAKIPSEMRYYSDLYGVGVLVIEMDTKDFDDLMSKKPRSSPYTLNDVDIRELYSAPFHHVQPQYTAAFLDNLEINDPVRISTFGEVLTEQP